MARPVHRRVWPKPAVSTPLDPLHNRHAGETATIIGRGPSLLLLRREDIGPGPVIAMNHAIEQVRRLKLPNPLYSQQKDKCMVPPQAPETLILSRAQSAKCFPSYKPRYVVDVQRQFGITPRAMSTTMAVSLAYWMGCRKVRMLACDAVTAQDFRTVVGELALEKRGFGYLFAGKQASQRALALGMTLEWVAP